MTKKPHIKINSNVVRMQRNDGYFNAFSGAGNKTVTSGSFRVRDLYLHELEDAYRTSGLIKKIVDIMPEESMRAGYVVDADNGLEVVNAINEASLSADSKIIQASKMGRLYGGAAIIVITDDSDDLEEPLNVDAVSKILALQVVSMQYLHPITTNLVADLRDPNFNLPEFYRLSKKSTSFFPSKEDSMMDIHRSRILFFGGAGSTMDIKERYNNYWDDSIVQLVWDRVTHLYESLASSSSIAKNFVQQVLKIDRLGEAIMGGNHEYFKARLAMLEESMNSLNILALDGEEDFVKQTASISGLSDIIMDHRLQVCADTGIPYSKLFGQSPGGLNSSGESEENNFTKQLESWRDAEIEPNIKKLITLGYKHIGATAPEQWAVSWNELDPMSEVERAEVGLKTAQVDEIYVAIGARSPSEVREARHGVDAFKNPIELEAGANLMIEQGPDNSEVE
jgi:phage-related protein (TIGR01555 family)